MTPDTFGKYIDRSKPVGLAEMAALASVEGQVASKETAEAASENTVEVFC